MSNYNNHWSSESNESTTINKLVESTNYEIVDVEKLKTQFGTKYVLVADTGFILLVIGVNLIINTISKHKTKGK